MSLTLLRAPALAGDKPRQAALIQLGALGAREHAHPTRRQLAQGDRPHRDPRQVPQLEPRSTAQPAHLVVPTLRDLEGHEGQPPAVRHVGCYHGAGSAAADRRGERGAQRAALRGDALRVVAAAEAVLARSQRLVAEALHAEQPRVPSSSISSGSGTTNDNTSRRGAAGRSRGVFIIAPRRAPFVPVRSTHCAKAYNFANASDAETQAKIEKADKAAAALLAESRADATALNDKAAVAEAIAALSKNRKNVARDASDASPKTQPHVKRAATAAAADEAIDAALVVLDGGKARISGEAKVAAAAIAARLCAPRDMGAPAAAALRHTLLVLAEKKPRGSRLLKALQIFFFWL